VIESYLKGFESFSRDGGREAPQWTRSLRLSGITRFEELGFPTTKNEDWHFTSVAPIAERDFAPLTTGEPPAPRKITTAQLAPFSFGATDWHTLVFVNGRFDAKLSRTAGLPDGVQVLPLARAYDELPLLVEQHIGFALEVADLTHVTGDGLQLDLHRVRDVDEQVGLLPLD